MANDKKDMSQAQEFTLTTHMIDEKQAFTLKNGDVAIIINENEIKYISNSSREEMNEIEVAAAGAAVALTNPVWRQYLEDLMIEDSVEVYEVEDDHLSECEVKPSTVESLMDCPAFGCATDDDKWYIN